MKLFFSGTQKTLIFGVWTAPGAPETTPKGGARSALYFEVVSGDPRGRPDPQQSMIAGSLKNIFSIFTFA